MRGSMPMDSCNNQLQVTMKQTLQTNMVLPLPDHHENLEKKSGRLCMHLKVNGHEHKLCVFVKVYMNAFDHYAIVNQDRRFGGASTYMNLKNYSIEVFKTGHRFQLLSAHTDGASVTFSCNSEEEAESWVAAMKCDDLRRSGSRSPVIPRSPVMPTLEEDDEDT